jgi:hypothetical protein
MNIERMAKSTLKRRNIGSPPSVGKVDQIPPPEAPGFGEQAEEPFQTGALHPARGLGLDRV